MKINKKQLKYEITREQFHALIKKASQSVRKPSESNKSETGKTVAKKGVEDGVG